MTAVEPCSPFDPGSLPGLALSAAALPGAGATVMEPACQLAIEANFGSVARWREGFKALALDQLQAGGLGWLLLVFQPERGTLANRWVAEAPADLAGDVPLLALDLHDQASRAALAADAAAQVAACLDRVDWPAVYGRYQQAVHHASAPFGASADDMHKALVLDVRRAGVFAQAATVIPGARWCDPAAVGAWGPALPTDRPVLVYCVFGHEVGRVTALRLRSAGLNARYLEGGIDGWLKAGRATQAKLG